jgi:hypothetical protein
MILVLFSRRDFHLDHGAFFITLALKYSQARAKVTLSELL